MYTHYTSSHDWWKAGRSQKQCLENFEYFQVNFKALLESTFFLVSSSEKSTSRLIFNPCLNFSHVHFLQYNKCGPLQKKKRCKIKIVCWIWPIPPKIINLIKMLIRSFHNSNQCYIPPSSFFFFFFFVYKSHCFFEFNILFNLWIKFHKLFVRYQRWISKSNDWISAHGRCHSLTLFLFIYEMS